MKEVNWSFLTSTKWGVEHLDSLNSKIDYSKIALKSLTKEVSSTRKKSTFLKCPAHTDFIKNTFIFVCPFDIKVIVDISDDKKRIHIPSLTQEMFDAFIDIRFIESYHSKNNPYPLLGMDFLNVFTCEEPTHLQVFPAFMHNNEFTRKTSIVPGEYNIGKWTRPIEMVFEIFEPKQEINILKGDALMYFKFQCDKTIKIIKSDVPWNEMQLCDSIRKKNTFRPLKERYQTLKHEREKICPYAKKN